MTTGVIILIVVGVLVVIVCVGVLVSAQRRHPDGFGWYAGRVGTRNPVPEEFYDPTADPDYRGDGLGAATDATLRGDLALPDPPATPPATESG